MTVPCPLPRPWRLALHLAAAPIGLVVVACAYGPEPPPATVVSTEPRKPQPGRPPAPDLSPVEAPAGLFIVDRYANPTTWLEQVVGTDDEFRWLRLPCITGRARAIDASGSVDEVSILDERSWGPVPEPLTVISVGLKDIDATAQGGRLCGHRAELVGPGVRRLVLDDEDRTCLVAAAAGSAATRLVCGPRRAVDRLWPYLVRGVPRDPPPRSDRHFEIDFSVMQRRYEQRWASLPRLGPPVVLGWLQGRSPRLAEALTPHVQNLMEEGLTLVSDVEKLSADTHVGTAARDVELVLKLQARNSWTARTALNLAQRSQASPDLYWRLPADSEGAWFVSNVEQDAYRQVLAALSDSLHRYFGSTSLDRKTAELVVRTFLPQRPTVYAHGSVSVDMPDACSPQLIRNAGMAAMGWHLVGVPDRSSDYRRHFVAGMNAYNRGQLRSLAYRQSNLCKGLPKISVRRRPPAELPPGSTVFEMAIPGRVFDQCFEGPSADHPSAEPLSYLVILVEHGDQTWIGFSGDERTLVRRLARAVADAPSRSDLAARKDLRELMRGRPLFGGFITRNGRAAWEELGRMFTTATPFRDVRSKDAGGSEAVALVLTADPSASTVTLRVRMPNQPPPPSSGSAPDCGVAHP